MGSRKSVVNVQQACPDRIFPVSQQRKNRFIDLPIVHYMKLVNYSHSGEGRNQSENRLPQRGTKEKSMLNKPAGFRLSPE
jgi:hypothetical protein